MDNKLKKFKLESGELVVGGVITTATTTNFCSIICLEGDSRINPNSVQLSIDFIGRNDAKLGDLLFLDKDSNWSISKAGFESVGDFVKDESETSSESVSKSLEILQGKEAELQQKALDLNALSEQLSLKALDCDQKLQDIMQKKAEIAEQSEALKAKEESLTAREAAVVEAEAGVAKAKAELAAQAGSAKAAPSTTGIKVTGG